MAKQWKRNTRKKPALRKCDLGCPCNDTGFMYVINDGQFKTASGKDHPDEEVLVLCNGSKGEWIRLHSNKQRLPSYDPETMRFKGQSVQNQLF